MSAPSLPSLLFTHWQLAWPLNLEAAVAAGIYLAGARRVRGGWPPLRTLAFLAGIGLVLVALQSGLDAYDDRLLSAHMLQHLLLMVFAPALLIGGRPVLLALRALPAPQRRRLARAIARLRPVAGPWQGLALYCVVVLGTHLPGFYDAALRTPPLHDGEHVLYLLAGTLMLWPLLDGDPVPAHRLGGLGKLVYLLVAMVPMAVIGSYLNRYTAVVYAPYRDAARALGISAVRDQATAGAVMWVVGNTAMVLVGLWAVMSTLVREERRQSAREARAAAALGERLAAGGEP